MIFQYNLREKKNKDGYVYTEICREMYGLPVAVILAQKLIEKRLNKEGNKHSKVTPGVWTHEWLPVRFTLCVDDFFVKYVGKKYADHVIVVLSKRYKISSDWAGKCYLGLGLDWNDEKREMHLSILAYIIGALKCFNHENPQKPQDQPYIHVKPNYGAKAQYTKQDDTSALLIKEDKKFIQEVIGMFLYYT